MKIRLIDKYKYVKSIATLHAITIEEAQQIYADMSMVERKRKIQVMKETKGKRK